MLLVIKRLAFLLRSTPIRPVAQKCSGDFYCCSTRVDDEDRPKRLAVKNKQWKEYREDFRHGHGAWRPKKRLTRDQMDHLRTLRQESQDLWTLPKLAKAFGISVPSVVRILRSKFEPPSEVCQRQDAKAIKQRKEGRHKKGLID